MNRDSLKLYLVTDSGMTRGRRLDDIVGEAVRGGVTMVQLREKNACTRDLVETAVRLRNLLSPAGVPLIINDRVDVALAVDADGVHIGQSDMPYECARRILGYNKIIGLSVESLIQVESANKLDIDYIGVSPVFGTLTKTDTAAPFGLDGLEEAVRLSRHPSVGIGGMNRETVAEVFARGCDGIAVVSAIMTADDPFEAALELRHIAERQWMNSNS